jgi:hypothetical protein
MFMLWVGRGGREGDPSRRDIDFYDVDLSLSAMVKARRSDHKQIQKLLRALQSKLAVKQIREPDVRRAIPARYRVYSDRALFRLRQEAGLRWMVKTAAVQLIDDATASQWQANSPIGYQPMGESPADRTSPALWPAGDSPAGPAPEANPLPPAGRQPDPPMGHRPIIVNTLVSRPEPAATANSAPQELARELHNVLGPFTGDLPQLLWDRGREVDPNLTAEELVHVVTAMAPKATKGRSTGFVLSLLQSFLRGPSLAAYREEKRRRDEAEHLSESRDIQFWKEILADPTADPEAHAYARQFLSERASKAP